MWGVRNQEFEQQWEGKVELVVQKHGQVNGVGKCGMITDRIKAHWRFGVINLK